MECTETHGLLFAFGSVLWFADILMATPGRALTSCTSEFFFFLISANISPSSSDDEMIIDQGSS